MSLSVQLSVKFNMFAVILHRENEHLTRYLSLVRMSGVLLNFAPNRVSGEREGIGYASPG